MLDQFARFLVVGLISFAVDYGLYILLLNWVYYILASSISFTISLVLNYILTLKFVFRVRSKRNVAKEFVLFIALNIIALGLNQAILFVSVEWLSTSELSGKIVATACVLVYNFISRKMLIERSLSLRRTSRRNLALPETAESPSSAAERPHSRPIPH